MRDQQKLDLERLGLAPAEAEAYLALLRNGGTLGAKALAAAIEVARPNVYPILSSLADKGMVEAEAGYGSRFTAVPPRQALPALIAREKQEVLQRERDAAAVADQLESLIESSPGPTEETVDLKLVQVLRDPRVVAERYNRLRLAANRSVDVFVKAPLFTRPGPDPVLDELISRGVRCRGLYERAIVDAPDVRPYLTNWRMRRDDVRVFDGVLPHKLAVFDRAAAFISLTIPGDQVRTVYVKHAELSNSLGILFDTFWAQGQPIKIPKPKKSVADSASPIRIHKYAPNGHGDRVNK